MSARKISITDFHHGETTVDLAGGGVLVVDIDGTIADITHRKQHVEVRPKNWELFFKDMASDLPIPHIIDVVLEVSDHPEWTVVLCTGRGAEHRAVTEDWLALHSIPYEKLYMRKKGDRRTDDIVKASLLRQMREEGYEPRLVLEDRDRVVQMWRDHGIQAVQVAEGNF